jgi:hypothetical protein
MGNGVIFRRHATDQMHVRGIEPDEVRSALATGETIEEPAEGTENPVRLVLGYTEFGPLHVAVVDDEVTGAMVVVTAYRPSLLRWQPDWRTRRGR